MERRCNSLLEFLSLQVSPAVDASFFVLRSRFLVVFALQAARLVATVVFAFLSTCSPVSSSCALHLFVIPIRSRFSFPTASPCFLSVCLDSLLCSRTFALHRSLFIAIVVIS